jgi:hypothetical protein
MDLVQPESGHGMFEILLTPPGVTVYAHLGQFGNALAGRVTGPAIERIMISIQGPTGGVVRETRPFLDIVTLAALVIDMAVIADGVHLFLSLRGRSRSLNIMAVAAVFLPVAVHAPEPKQVDVFFMLKSNDFPRFIRSMIHFLYRLGDHRMGDTHDIRAIGRMIGYGRTGCWNMAHNALGVVAPLAVTGKTLPMVGTLQRGLVKIVGVFLTTVTFFTRRNVTFGAVMMTGDAVAAHLGHFRMM